MSPPKGVKLFTTSRRHHFLTFAFLSISFVRFLRNNFGYGENYVKQEKITRFIRTEDADRKWYLVDAKDLVLGRMATQVARIIRGKNKVIFTPNMDTGDFVVVINADKVKLTGKRVTLKTYVRHSGYPGGQKVTTFLEMMKKKPEFVIQNAVKGMLPKNRLGRKLIKKLKVYAGEDHPHKAQKPETLILTEK
ncbi:MAG: 50S ribosomal protein L13 [Bacteroidetes bacterium]|nr:50S ribosomal protein L13 [Bacteroidota bacterium]